MDQQTTSEKHYGLVWVDHHAARVIRVLSDGNDPDVTAIEGDEGQTHERKHDGGHRHAMSAQFSDRIAEAVRSFDALVVAGPSTAKGELMSHLRDRHRDIAARVRAVETLDRATDPQLVAEGRKLFERIDRMRGVHVPQSAR